jgi:hypothetical protein
MFAHEVDIVILEGREGNRSFFLNAIILCHFSACQLLAAFRWPVRAGARLRPL